MFRIIGPGSRLCDGLSRREVLRVGSLGLLGAGLSPLVGRNPAFGASVRPSNGRARSCIVLFLMGGPPQHSTWDPKPEAPEEIRGQFGAIESRTPGLFLSELLPRTARISDKLCLLRAMSTGDNAHSSSGYYMMTGQPHAPKNFENANPGPPNDAPNLGALVGRLRPPPGAMPASVRLPQHIFNTDGSVWPGQDAGRLGHAADPWLLHAKLSDQNYRIDEVNLPGDLDPDRLGRRGDLLRTIEQTLDRFESSPVVSTFDEHTRQAFQMLQKPETRQAFEVDREPEALRQTYGMTPFGQGALLARRLVQSGVRLVQLNWYRGPDEPSANPCWDSHTDETNRLKDVLVPPTDAALSALVEDLDNRGMLDETLVVCMSEFGRTPRMASNGGRGHWGSVFSIALAGGGIRGGQVFGASDAIGGQPRDGLVRPEDLLATIVHALGIDPGTEYLDHLGRPFPVSRGQVLHALF